MKKIIIPAILIINLIAGCRKDVDLSPVDKKIVVNAQISPTDDSIKVNLQYSKTLNAITKIENDFSDATVTLSDGVTSRILTGNPKKGLFFILQSDFKLIPGKAYFLKVNDGHNREITAGTTIPFAVTNAVYTILNEVRVGKNLARYSNKFEFTDQLNQVQRYRFYSEIKETGSSQDVFYGNQLEERKIPVNQSSFIMENTVDYIAYNSPVYRNGYFITCSEEYYKLYKNLTGIDGNNLPGFTNESANIYTNINGGLGIFAGYNLVKLAGKPATDQ